MFGDPIFLGGLLAVLAAVTLVDAVRGRAELFDQRFTPDDRQRIVRLVLFGLLPISVLAHEGGHAVAVKAFGGEVVDFGFYFFYGFVGHRGAYTHDELALISFAGPLVNVVSGLTALAVAWYRARRAAVSYLLFVFGAVELANALIFYPLLDAFGGLAGDWETIYSRDTPVFSILIGVNHVALLVAAAIIWRSSRFQAGYAQRTGQGKRMSQVPNPLNPAGSGDGGDGGTDDSARHPEEQEMSGILAVAAALAANGWRHPVQLISDAQAGGSQIVLRWESLGFQRALLVHATYSDDPEQHVELHAAVEAEAMGVPPFQRALARIDGRPSAHELVPYVRRFLDFVDTWNGSTLVSPN